MKRIKTIDAEVAGEAVRLVVGGGPSVTGRTMADKLNWLRRNGGELRRLLMLEPRGHAAMHGAMLTEPISTNAHAGMLSMHAAGFPLISGEGIMGAITIALEQKLIVGVDDGVLIDTPVGLFRTQSQAADLGITQVAVTGVPSFVHSAGLSVRVGARSITVDIAFGGEFYAIADSEAIGVSVDMANAAALVSMGREIKNAVESAVHVEHPTDLSLKGIHGTIFTGAPRTAADLRSATVLDGEVLRRSPGVTGTAALIAVLDAMGLLTEDQRFTHEGLLGTTLQGRVLSRLAGEPSTVIPVIEGAASITGFHEFIVQLDSAEAM
jgi:proline racemase